MGQSESHPSVFACFFSLSYGANESHEGFCYVSICCVQLSCRNDRVEGQGRQGRRGGLGRSCRRGVEKDRILQACWRVEFEIEEEACNASAQRCESFHQGAVCFQGQASIQDRESVPHEETKRVDQLRLK